MASKNTRGEKNLSECQTLIERVNLASEVVVLVVEKAPYGPWKGHSGHWKGQSKGHTGH